MKRNSQNGHAQDSWGLFKGTRDGKPLLLRLNMSAERFAGNEKFKHEVGIALPFRSQSADGLPSDETNTALGKVEDKVVGELEKKNLCVFVAAVTTDKIRELVFYTSDPGALFTQVETLKAELSPQDIQLLVQEDSGWNIYKFFFELAGRSKSESSGEKPTHP